jgi:hypothetical protein
MRKRIKERNNHVSRITPYRIVRIVRDNLPKVRRGGGPGRPCKSWNDSLLVHTGWQPKTREKSERRKRNFPYDSNRKQRQPVDVFNGEVLCFLCGKDWILNRCLDELRPQCVRPHRTDGTSLRGPVCIQTSPATSVHICTTGCTCHLILAIRQMKPCRSSGG